MGGGNFTTDSEQEAYLRTKNCLKEAIREIIPEIVEAIKGVRVDESGEKVNGDPRSD